MTMTESRPTPAAKSVAAIWAELRDHLGASFRQLNSEVRHYPTPIARCDAQLPKLLEQRDHARTELERMRAIDACSGTSAAPTVREIERFLDAAPPADDETELALRARLEAALSAAKR